MWLKTDLSWWFFSPSKVLREAMMSKSPNLRFPVNTLWRCFQREYDSFQLHPNRILLVNGQRGYMCPKEPCLQMYSLHKQKQYLNAIKALQASWWSLGQQENHWIWSKSILYVSRSKWQPFKITNPKKFCKRRQFQFPLLFFLTKLSQTPCI